MIVSTTVFDHIKDNKTGKRMDFQSWESFESFLYKLSLEPIEKKADAKLISPAVYVPDSLRRNVNVLAWQGWAALDVDDHDFGSDDLEQKLVDKYGDWYYICYSTASSSLEKPKFRMVFPLSCPCEKENIYQFWHALNIEFNQLGDKQVKDYSRMYYVPGTYKNAFNFFYVNNQGKVVNIFDLIEKHPAPPKGKPGSFLDRLPESLQREVVKHRQDSLKNNIQNQYTWTSYKDCPFINKKMILDYKKIALLDGTGRYRMIFQLMSSIATRAIFRKYPITPEQIADLVGELDNETSRRYQRRPLVLEASRAIEFAYRNM